MQGEIKEKLVELVKKYADKACSCEVMMGFTCGVHEEVREDLKEVENPSKEDTSYNIVQGLQAESDALFDIINEIKKELDARGWIFEGRGSYAWDDDQYRRETGWSFNAIRDLLEIAVRNGRQRYNTYQAFLK